MEQQFDNLTDESLLDRMTRSFSAFKTINGIQDERFTWYAWLKWLAS